MTLVHITPLAKNDPVFRRWLLDSPEAALIEAGIEVPVEMTAAVLDGTPESVFQMLPEAANDDLPNEPLASANAGL